MEDVEETGRNNYITIGLVAGILLVLFTSIYGILTTIKKLDQAEIEVKTEWETNKVTGTAQFDHNCNDVRVLEKFYLLKGDTPDAFTLNVCGVVRKYRRSGVGYSISYMEIK